MFMNNFQFNKLYRSSESKGTPMKQDTKEVKSLKKKLLKRTLSQIDTEFYNYIIELINEGKEYSQADKNATVENIIEYYWKQTGLIIPTAMQSSLADFLLDDTLADTSNNKVQTTEYPILSYRQFQKRGKHQTPLDHVKLDYFSNKNTSGIATKRNTSERAEG